jgi:hypothetical protein
VRRCERCGADVRARDADTIQAVEVRPVDDRTDIIEQAAWFHGHCWRSVCQTGRYRRVSRERQAGR